MPGFQTAVQTTPAIAIAGDFASGNPRAAVVAPEGGFVAGTAGVTVGRFAWIDTDGKSIKNTGTGKPDGFIHREQQALISVYLAETSNVIPAGFPVTLMRTGDYFAGVTVATAEKGEKAFAKLSDGTMQPAAAGATVAGYVETDFTIARGAAVGEVAVITL